MIITLILIETGALLLVPTFRKKPPTGAKLFLRCSIHGEMAEEIPLHRERELRENGKRGL